MTEYVTEIRHTVNEKVNEDEDGEPIFERVNRVEYDFTDEVSDAAKEKVRNHVPPLLNKPEIRQVIEQVDG